MKIKKVLLSLLFTLLFCVTTTIPVFATSNLPRLVDNADLLTNKEESLLLSKLDEISDKHKVDIVVVTVNSLDGKSPMNYADDFYDYNGYGFNESNDGILILVSMEDRDWWISTTGFGITAITDAGIDYISEQFLPYLSDGNYIKAFTTYANLCDDFITQAETGNAYDIGHMPKKPFNVARNLLIAVIIGFVIALIVVFIMKSQLKSVRSQPAANSYVKKNSMNITERNDVFLYAHTDQRLRPRDTDSGGGSSTHSSSSGSSHGGGGGKF